MRGRMRQQQWRQEGRLWLRKTEPHRPRANLEVQVLDQVRAFFAVAIVSYVGNGVGTLFWTDRWLHEQRMADLAPSLFAAIPQRRRRQHTVQTTLLNHAWVLDIQGSLTSEIIVEYIQVWDLINEPQLMPKVDDAHRWRLDTCGQYSAKSAYGNLFLGATMFLSCERIWKSWTPQKCKMFMWPVAHKRC
jgi:hypothetical protein